MPVFVETNIQNEAAPEPQTQSGRIIKKFGGMAALARALGHKNPTTVQGWLERGYIPSRHQTNVLNKARELGKDVERADFFFEEEPETAT